MYFGTGASTRVGGGAVTQAARRAASQAGCPLPDTESGGRLIPSPDRTLLALLHPYAMAIYSFHPSVLLACHFRGNHTPQLGHNVIAAWRPGNASLVVLTSENSVLIYAVTRAEENSGVFRSSLPTQDTYAPSEPSTLNLTLKRTLLFSSVSGGLTAKCLVARTEHILVATVTGEIVALRWDGVIDEEDLLTLKDIPNCGEMKGLYAVAMDAAKHQSRLAEMSLHQFGSHSSLPSLDSDSVTSASPSGLNVPTVTKSALSFLWGSLGTSTDKAAIATPGISHEYLGCRIAASGPLLIGTGKSRLVFNGRMQLIAVGDADGVVSVYTVDVAAARILLAHKLLLPRQNSPASGSGSITDLSWTSDGMALAVSYEHAGFAVWSVFGYLLLLSSNCVIQPMDSAAVKHVRADGVAWSQLGYSLLVSHQSAKNAGTHELSAFQFVKSALIFNNSADNSTSMLLLGSDRILVRPKTGIDEDVLPDTMEELSATSLQQWCSIQVPSTYLQVAGPCRVAAASVEQNSVAVAGKRGFLVSIGNRNKWRVFRNHAFEQRLAVQAMCWWNNLLVVSLIDAGVYKLCWFSVQQNFDSQSVIHEVVLPRACRLVNVVGDDILLYLSDRRVLIYHCGVLKDRLALTLKYDFDATQYIALGASVSCIYLLADAEGRSLLLTVCGTVMSFRLDLNSNRVASGPVVLSRETEILWPPVLLRSPREDIHLCSALFFGRGAHGMKVWLPLYEEDDIKRLQRKATRTTGPLLLPAPSKRVFLTFPVHFYTLSISYTETLLTGISVEPRDGLFVLEQKSRTFLDSILRILIRRSLDRQATVIAKTYEHLPFFAHALELMLHEVLEEESAVMSSYRPDAELPRVVDFIGRFKKFLQIIGHCARKTEVSCWDYLFSVVGDPKSLFEQCLAADDLNAAASYLLILQSLEPAATSLQFATRMLDMALESQRFQLADDIIRFVYAISSDHGSLIGDSDGEKNVFVDILLTRHARKLILHRRLRSLCEFAVDLHYPLATWLKQERHRAAKVGVDQVILAMQSLQREFSSFSMDALTTSPSFSNLPRLPSSSDNDLIPLSDFWESEKGLIKYFYDVTMAGGCYEWAMLVALLLNDGPWMRAVVSSVRRDSDFEGGLELLVKEATLLRQSHQFDLEPAVLNVVLSAEAGEQLHSCFDVTFA